MSLAVQPATPSRSHHVVAGAVATAGPGLTSTFDRAARISGSHTGRRRRRPALIAAAGIGVVQRSSIA